MLPFLVCLSMTLSMNRARIFAFAMCLLFTLCEDDVQASVKEVVLCSFDLICISENVEARRWPHIVSQHQRSYDESKLLQRKEFGDAVVHPIRTEKRVSEFIQYDWDCATYNGKNCWISGLTNAVLSLLSQRSGLKRSASGHRSSLCCTAGSLAVIAAIDRSLDEP